MLKLGGQVAQVGQVDGSIDFSGFDSSCSSALSRLNIRIDGGPGGCGREGRRKV